MTDAAKCTNVRFGTSGASRQSHENGAFNKDQSVLIPAYDFSEAELVSGPHALRDGGSIVLVLRVKDTKLQLRYAGGFRDALREHDGMLEVTPFGEQVSGNFWQPDECLGLASFISRYEADFGKFAEYFLGQRRRTDEQINEFEPGHVNNEPNGLF